ncbi:MAG: virulence RhuM family protein [Magnetococcales bacterium]|nr:virulence RhuM family protein [Magnetococcales bacterium]
MSSKKLKKPPVEADILFYKSDDEQVKIDVLYQGETIWLTQKRMSELFGVQVPAITKHLKNIFETRELDEDSVVSILETTASDNKSYQTRYYNLDAIIAVGYRVNSKQATQFRIWATGVLKEFIIKGFALDSERLKNGEKFGHDYFDELLEKIREIRASERCFYQKITDIYAECSADYDSDDETSRTFYATVQNKLHWAIHGLTAAEMIESRADREKPKMGLTTWKQAPKGKILKSDVSIAKNYLSEQELDELNHIVTMYLDYAELQAKKNRVMKMEDWVQKLDAFLVFNDYQLLSVPGKTRASVAKALAEKEYAAFRVTQDRTYKSGFDELVNSAEKSPQSVKKKPKR